MEKIKNILDKHAPEKTKVLSARNILRAPWMTPGLLKSSQHCDKLYKQCVGCNKNHHNFIAFIEYRNQYNKIKRKAKLTYYQDKLNSYRNDSKNLWKTLNEIIGKNRGKSSISDTFIVNGMETTDPRAISNGFCRFFTNVGKDFAANIPNAKKSYRNYLHKKNDKSLFLSPCVPNDILRMISSLKPKKSKGHDNLSAIFVKSIKNEISEPLSVIVNKSFESGIFPNDMKLAKLIPLYKKKDKKDMTNYLSLIHI